MGWADYGFPDPMMMPCYLPALALYIARVERLSIPDGRPSDISEDYIPSLFKQETGRHFMQGNDIPAKHSWKIPSGYINPILDFTGAVTIDDNGMPDIFLTEPKVAEILTAHDASGLGYLDADSITGNLEMLPEWSKAWLYQRYLAYNMLKLFSAKFVVTMRGGSSSDKNTIEEAYNSAVAASYTYTFNSTAGASIPDALTTVTNIAYSAGKYGCGISRIEKIELDTDAHPNLIDIDQNIYICARLEPSMQFDAHGMPIQYTNNVFSIIKLPYIANGIPMPDQGLNVGSCGFITKLPYMAPWAFCIVDVSSKFEFYDNVDNL